MRTLLFTLSVIFTLTLSSVVHAEEGGSSYSEAELLAAVQRHAPERYARLMKLKEADPARYLEALDAVEQLLLQKEEQKAERQEATAELKARKEALLARYDEARTDRQREAIRAELEALAREYLLLRMDMQQARLERARERLETMEDELAAKRARVDELAAEFVEEGLRRHAEETSDQ